MKISTVDFCVVSSRHTSPLTAEAAQPERLFPVPIEKFKCEDVILRSSKYVLYWEPRER